MIHKIDKGVLQGWKAKDKRVETVARYTDGKGCARYKGTDKLKKTETLDSIQYHKHYSNQFVSWSLCYPKIKFLGIMDLCCCVFRTLYYISEFGQIAYIDAFSHKYMLLP